MQTYGDHMSECYLANRSEDAPCRCDNCGTVTPAGKLEMIEDIEQRLDPGCIVPAGQCPGCHSLAYLADPEEWTSQHRAGAFSDVVAFVNSLDGRKKPSAPSDLKERADSFAEFVHRMASFTTPEDEFGDPEHAASKEYDDVADYIADFNDERLCSELQAFMVMIREAREISAGLPSIEPTQPTPARIYVLTAEHLSVPGIKTEAHASIESATASAVDLVNIMLADNGDIVRATAEDWKLCLQSLQTEHGEDRCYASIEELNVIGANNNEVTP